MMVDRLNTCFTPAVALPDVAATGMARWHGPQRGVRAAQRLPAPDRFFDSAKMVTMAKLDAL